MRDTLFGDLPLRTRFRFYGKHYTKIAMSMAKDENGNGNIFQAETKVETDEPIGPSVETGENPS